MSAASISDGFREAANTASTAIPTRATLLAPTLHGWPYHLDKNIMSHGLHKFVSFAEWTFPIGAIAAGFSAHASKLMAQVPGGSLDAANSRYTLIALGVVLVLTKAIESVLTGYEKYRTITDKSEHGKYAACMAELNAQKESYEREIARLRSQAQSITSDYEVRLQSKRDETEYYRNSLAVSRKNEEQLQLANASLMATIVQQNQSMSQLAHRSVDNTKEAISKITTPAFTGPGSSTSIPVVPPVTVVAVDAHQAPCDPPEENRTGDK